MLNIDNTNNNDDGINRRENDRKMLHTRAILAIPGKPILEVRTLDISIGGIGIVASVNLVARIPCKLAFSLPLRHGKKINVEAEGYVTHSLFSNSHDGFKIGIRFKDVSPELEKEIARYLRT